MSWRAERPGEMPTESRPDIEGWKLPPGRVVESDFAPDAKVPLWVSEQVVDGVGLMWPHLAGAFAKTGLWPIVMQSLRGADTRPWVDGEVDPSVTSRPEDHDAKEAIAFRWQQAIPINTESPSAFEDLAPFAGEMPELAAPGPEGDADVLPKIVEQLEGRLGLVATTRPADAITRFGWMGPVNYYDDVAPLSAVLRSWEDRFDAYVVGVGFATLTLAVERPPRDLDHALVLAAEHFAMCPDNVWQDAGSLQAYAERLVSRHWWSFWWD